MLHSVKTFYLETLAFYLEILISYLKMLCFSLERIMLIFKNMYIYNAGCHQSKVADLRHYALLFKI